MEVSNEMLKIIELIKAGEVELVEQLLIGNPELCSDSSNEMTNKVYSIIWLTNDDVREDWYDRSGCEEEGWTIKNWLMYWVNFRKNELEYDD